MKTFLTTSVFIFVIFFLITLISNSAADVNSLLYPESYGTEFIPNSSKILKPVILTEPLSIDGLIDSLWFENTLFGNFTEFEPAENKRPAVITAGYVAYDQKNLYVAFICQDHDMSLLRASLTDRDNIYNDDWVCVSIDPDNDQ
ncbi:MAG: hypothetical protein EH225_13510, partial [Calditrichaeota bacterium]